MPKREIAVVAGVVLVVVLAFAWLALRPVEEQQVAEPGRDHAEVACDLTTKAGEAAQMDTSARYAAAVLLLDKAMIESERASESEPRFSELDAAVREVHRAGHRQDPEQWDLALNAALGTCESSVG